MEENQATKIIPLNSENASFFVKNGFLGMKYKEQEFSRVFLHRIFPFEKEWEYISVMGEDLQEIGIIKDIDCFPESIKELLTQELQRKYYVQKVEKIVQLKERYGFSYWNIITAENRQVNFTMQDTFRNILRVGEDKAVLMDVDGNRFVIESITALDRKSYKKIELYL